MANVSVDRPTNCRFAAKAPKNGRALKFYDFFAGAGMATLGLSSHWECIWANDIDERKAKVYSDFFGLDHYICNDVAKIAAESLPKPAHHPPEGSQ